MSDDVVAMREWLDALRQDPQAAKDQEGIARSLNQRIAQSMRRVEKRRKQIPAVSFPAHLPVSNRLEDITEAISKHQVIVLSGETGSGKSTQLPKMCLAMGRGAGVRLVAPSQEGSQLNHFQDELLRNWS